MGTARLRMDAGVLGTESRCPLTYLDTQLRRWRSVHAAARFGHELLKRDGFGGALPRKFDHARKPPVADQARIAGDILDELAVQSKGEKRSESEDKDRQFSERYYGRFERRIPLGVEVDEDKVAASFRNGVLTVTLPKTEKAQTQVKRIAIKS